MREIENKGQSPARPGMWAESRSWTRWGCPLEPPEGMQSWKHLDVSPFGTSDLHCKAIIVFVLNAKFEAICHSSHGELMHCVRHDVNSDPAPAPPPEPTSLSAGLRLGGKGPRSP